MLFLKINDYLNLSDFKNFIIGVSILTFFIYYIGVTIEKNNGDNDE